jgi:DNA sulfur modification protein DndD
MVNFRQFKGEQAFDLSPAPDRPVTIIFGANGAGKTTLLNAFTWALYGELSADVEEQHRIVNDTVWRETDMGGHVELSVELTFEHEGQSYRLRRGTQVYKGAPEQQSVSANPQLWVTRPGGSNDEVSAPQEKIHSILPKGISRFFFFNGERIENLVKKGSYAEVKQDIRGLLDLEQVDRALEHLPKVDRKLTGDIRKHGGERAGALQAEIDELTDAQAASKEELTLRDAELATLTQEHDRVIELLRQNESVASVQAERDRVGTELEEARRQLKAAGTERALLVATRGFQAFTADLATDTAHLADALYEKGKLPAPLQRELVDRLLKEERCICGAPLAPGSQTRREIETWRERTGLAVVEAAWQRLRGQVADLSASRKTLVDDLQAAVGRITAERERVDRLVGTLSDLDGQLEGNRGEDVQKLEGHRIDLDTRARRKSQDIGALRSALDERQKKIDQKRHELRTAEVIDSLAAKARSRSDIVQAVEKALTEILEIREENMRSRLDAKLKKVYGQISYKPFTPELNADFELMLYHNSGGGLPVAKSTGENQILSLAFVAAVSELARENRSQRNGQEGMTDDGDYPIVMDAAFGSLDRNYRELVSRALGRMAPQLVVLVSKSQGLGEVIGELQPRINHAGVIVAHSTNSNTPAEDIELFGMAYPYITPSSDNDYAEMRSVK